MPTLFFKGGGEKGLGKLDLDYFSAVEFERFPCIFGQNTAYTFVHSKTIRLISSFCWWKLPAIGHMWWFVALRLAWVLVSHFPHVCVGLMAFWCSAFYFWLLDFLAQWWSQISLSVILYDTFSIRKHLYSAPVVNISRSAFQCIW